MLRLDDIRVRFGTSCILDNFSCSVAKEDFIIIVGQNGAGKTTLFDTIAGKVPPSQGKITLAGNDITRMSERHRAGMITRIFQNPRLNSVESYTVEQNLAMAHYSRRYAQFKDGMHALPHEKAVKIVHELGFHESILKKKMGDLSGGQRQLIAFGMATQRIPELLLLDEPTAALDPQAATTLLAHATRFIKQHKITTLLITHDPYIALSIGNKIWVLDRGVITKEYEHKEKSQIRPDQLIGHIDYEKLAHSNRP
jgi:putative tryptophan/tyrosine transport system ATP-binding protein